jgi:hypothetical protein
MSLDSGRSVSRFKYRGAISRAKQRRLERLDRRFRKILDTLESDPAGAVRETQAILRRNLNALVKAEGITAPTSKNLFELWILARSTFGDCNRFGPEFSISGRIDSLLMVVESAVVSELEGLPNNGFYIEGVGKPDYIGLPEARLIVLLGHVACIFIVEVWGANEDDRLLGIRAPRPLNCAANQTSQSMRGTKTVRGKSVLHWLHQILRVVPRAPSSKSRRSTCGATSEANFADSDIPF